MNLRVALTVTAAGTALLAQAQFGDLLKKPKIDIKLPSLSEITKGEAPLTTTIKDVEHFGWPELDQLQPKDFITLTQADRNENFTYTLKPGRYQLELRSFCGRGYTYGPTQGMGYLTGPWAGSKAGFLKELLTRYNKSTDVDQKDMQLLVWAVISRVQPKDMKGGARTALLKLMGDKGPELMAEGALDHFADELTGNLFREANRELRPLLEFDNKMRGLYAKANVPFEEFEKLAVLPEPATPPKTSVPRGRWLVHPTGYIYRFFPAGYSKTKMEVVVPRVPEVSRDDLRRITAITWPDYKFEISYNNEITPFKCPIDENLTGYAVNKVTFTTPDGPVELATDSWIFKGKPKAKTDNVKAQLLRFIRPAFQSGWSGWRDRYDRIQDTRDRIETYEEWYQRTQRIDRGDRPDEDVFDSGHVQDLLDSLRGGSDDRLEQIGETHGRLAEWLAHATRMIEGLGEDSDVDPGDGLIIPANPGGQRLMGSTQTW